jgi:hypothetical protein
MSGTVSPTYVVSQIPYWPIPSVWISEPPWDEAGRGRRRHAERVSMRALPPVAPALWHATCR